MKRLTLLLITLLAPILLPSPLFAQQWTASWTASAHGPYPIGNPTGQLELKYAFPAPEQGAKDQTFRLIVRPDAWGQQTRIRLSNAFGTQPVTFDAAYVGLQESGSAIVAGTNRPALFKGQKTVTVAPGASVVSDPVVLPFVKSPRNYRLPSWSTRVRAPAWRRSVRSEEPLTAGSYCSSRSATWRCSG